MFNVNIPYGYCVCKKLQQQALKCRRDSIRIHSNEKKSEEDEGNSALQAGT